MLDASAGILLCRYPSTTALLTMFTYEDSVLDAADHDGNLSHDDAVKLLKEHGATLDEIYADNHGVSSVALDAKNAEALLAWLGY
jgi:hypothetical protein